MKNKIKEIIKKANPKLFNEKEITINSFKKLGLGESNINYLVKINNKKYICRITNNENENEKVIREYTRLTKLEETDITPKTYFLHKPNKQFNRSFSIIEYIEGKPFRQRKRTFSDNQIKELAKLISGVHRINIKLPREEKNAFEDVFKYARIMLKQVNNYTQNKFKNKLNNIQKEIILKCSTSEKIKYAICHCDICPQNIIETKNKELKLIDWESIDYSDPARDIATVLINFKLNKKQEKLFLEEYTNNAKNKEILNRIETHKLLIYNNYLLWETARSFEIMNKDLDEEYLKTANAQSHIKEAKKIFEKLKKIIDIEEFNIEEIFKNNN